MTNFEKITKSPETLAGFIYYTINQQLFCSICKHQSLDKLTMEDCKNLSCYVGFTEWLDEPERGVNG